MHDEFVTVREGCRRELKVQGSKFLATVFPVDSVESADKDLAGIRSELHDATHHCFAYRLGPEGSRFRFSDGGEPGGTAGKPILSAIDREGVTDTLVVVTRYFGGVKLGTGVLSRAYSEAALQALRASPRVKRYVTTTFSASFPHAMTGQVMGVLGRYGATVLGTTYDEEVHLEVEIRLSQALPLKRQLVEQTAGTIKF